MTTDQSYPNMAPQHSIHCLSIIIFKNYVLLKYVLSEFVFFF